jgi:hypothetical protein
LPAPTDGRYPTLLAELARTDLLVLDDWGLTPLNDEQRRDLLEILDDRFNARSTLVTSQLPIAHWPEYLSDPTLADAILDRSVHCAYKLNLQGESMRKTQRQVDTQARSRVRLRLPRCALEIAVAELIGMPVRFPSDLMPCFHRNRCPLSAGFGGRFRRNTHPLGCDAHYPLPAFTKQDGPVTYFNGAMPVLAHDEEDVAWFLMVTAQFCVKSQR